MTLPPSAEPAGPPMTVPVCYRHPGRETYVRCTRCDRPICPECMREASVGHQCPECVSDGRRAQRSARTAFGGSLTGSDGLVTKMLIGLNLAVFLLGVALSTGGPLSALWAGAGTIHSMGAVVGPWVDASPEGAPGTVIYPGIDAGAYYRLFTAMFIHYGAIHLLMNMWALWVLGRPLEALLGRVRFLALYLLAGLGGNVAAYLISPDSLSAGASTAIFGLFAALFILLRRMGRDTSGILPVIIINLVFTFAVPNISKAGHIGGLITGALVGAALAYAPRNARTPVQAVALTIIGVALLGAAFIRSVLF